MGICQATALGIPFFMVCLAKMYFQMDFFSLMLLFIFGYFSLVHILLFDIFICSVGEQFH